MDRITRVSIVGMGALGVLYGDFFARTLGLEQVTFLADRDRVERYRDTRFTALALMPFGKSKNHHLK